MTINKNDIRIGDFILERSSGSILAPFIRFFTNSYYNHVAYFTLDYNKEWVIQEAVSDGLVEKPIATLIGRDILIMRPHNELSEVEAAEFIDLSRKIKGVKYDYLGTIFFSLIKALTGKWLGSRDNSKDKAKYCSEAYAFLYGKSTGLLKQYWKYSPEDLRKDTAFKPIKSGIVNKII